MNRKRIIVWGSLLLFLFCAFIFKVRQFTHWQKIERTRYYHMERIRLGCAAFSQDTGVLPASLETVVNAGYLPRYSNIYASPKIRQTMFPSAIPWNDADFLITRDGEFFIISEKTTPADDATNRSSPVKFRLGEIGVPPEMRAKLMKDE